MPGPLVDRLHSFGVRRLREAPHEPRVRISPGVFEVDALVVLDVDIGPMRCLEAIGRDAHHAPMYVHELRHRLPLSPANGRSVGESSIEPRSRAAPHANATVLAPAMTSSTTLAAPTMTDPLRSCSSPMPRGFAQAPQTQTEPPLSMNSW